MSTTATCTNSAIRKIVNVGHGGLLLAAKIGSVPRTQAQALAEHFRKASGTSFLAFRTRAPVVITYHDSAKSGNGQLGHIARFWTQIENVFALDRSYCAKPARQVIMDQRYSLYANPVGNGAFVSGPEQTVTRADYGVPRHAFERFLGDWLEPAGHDWVAFPSSPLAGEF